ncbi:MAG: hypothetical protein JSU96_03130, partial [Acidobacteriota bacterium]
MRPRDPRLALLLLICIVPAFLGSGWGQNSQITIDSSQTGEPISPYVYGQFIEHLGRCIYGGIWSEMLEDRKFYYPVTGEAPAWTMFKPGDRSWDGEGQPYELLTRSPWMIIGDHAAVTMEGADSYVGEQTPRITLHQEEGPAGILQERIGLVDGREYSGRIVLSGDASAAPITVSLVWGGGASDRATVTIDSLPQDYEKFPLEFRSGR